MAFGFQSYFSPILTKLLVDQKVAYLLFQSYFSPILTFAAGAGGIGSGLFQSYFSPILTQTRISPSERSSSFNPTLVQF